MARRDIVVVGGSAGDSSPCSRDGKPLLEGVIYVARPDHHLLVEHGRVSVTKGPRENRFRPAVDPLFRTAAQSHGRRVIGVILVSRRAVDGT